MCYACSVQCHGEHTLVEIFQKRNFTCDCGTTRIPSTSPCNLRTNNETNTRGGVHSEEPAKSNAYNQNFRNRFCGCECDYDPFEQKGTMFQCLGLGTAETGGCGEDWYHPGCLVGMGPRWFDKMKAEKPRGKPNGTNGTLEPISEDTEAPQEQAQDGQGNESAADQDDDPPMPPGFPEEDAFEGFICYKCVESNPWIKSYSGSSSFLPPVMLGGNKSQTQQEETNSKKRKAEDDSSEGEERKRIKEEGDKEDISADDANGVSKHPTEEPAKDVASDCKVPNLPTPPREPFSLFFTEDFREKFCRCSSCYERSSAHPQLLEEEEVYEPPLSNAAESEDGGGSTHGSGSLLERGESALRNVDRVRAIEGVMAYNHLKEQLKPFFQQFADSGQAIGAEDIKSYFAKLRGDEEGIKEAGEAAASSQNDRRDGNGDGSGTDGGQRREQSGY